MNTKLITQTCSSVNRKHTVPPPEGTNLHGNQGSTANEYPAPDESKRVLHTGRAELVTSPAIKDGAYDQETNDDKHKQTVCNTATLKPGSGPQTGKI